MPSIELGTGMGLSLAQRGAAAPPGGWTPVYGSGVVAGAGAARSFLRNTAASWTGAGVYSVETYNGVRTLQGIVPADAGTGLYIGFNTAKITDNPYDNKYAWRLNAAFVTCTPTSAGGADATGGTGTGGAVNLAAGSVVEMKRSGSSGNWTVEWAYYTAAALGVRVVHYTKTGIADETLNVLTGSFDNAATWSGVTIS